MNENTKAKWEYLLLRLLYIILFWFLSRLAWFVVGVLTLVQWLYVAVRGDKQRNLLDWSFSVIQYARQCGDFLTFQNEYKPFPFNDWPQKSDDQAPAE